MLYVHYGTDTDTVRAAALARASSYSDGGREIVRLEPDAYEPGQIYSALEAVSLFGEPPVYIIDTPSQDPELWSECVAAAPALAASDRIFIIIEQALLAEQKKKLSAAATEMIEAKVSAARFNTFAIADALLEKDKKQLWIRLQAALRADVSAEEIIGVLWWQIKMLLLAARTDGPDAAGVKPYPYQKASRALRTFRPGEVEGLAQSLLAVYHDGHAGRRDISVALERFVLEL